MVKNGVALMLRRRNSDRVSQAEKSTPLHLFNKKGRIENPSLQSNVGDIRRHGLVIYAATAVKVGECQHVLRDGLQRFVRRTKPSDFVNVGQNVVPNLRRDEAGIQHRVEFEPQPHDFLTRQVIVEIREQKIARELGQ